MGSNLDMVALEAAARRLAKDLGHDPDGCHFGHGQVGPDGGSFVCDVKYWESYRGTAAATIRAYLSASGLQAEITALRQIIQTYSEAHEAAVRQGVQMRDRMEEVGNV